MSECKASEQQPSRTTQTKYSIHPYSTARDVDIIVLDQRTFEPPNPVARLISPWSLCLTKPAVLDSPRMPLPAVNQSSSAIVVPNVLGIVLG